MEVLSLLRRAREAGLALAGVGDRLIVRGPRQAEPVVLLLAAHKGEILEALAEAAGWFAQHREVLAHWARLHNASEAAQLAWGEMQARWHRLHGERVPEWRCAGCGESIRGRQALPLGDGSRVHLDGAHGLDCTIAYGERWRGAATRALIAMGLQPPSELDIP
jgi:hypothetical protein